MAVAVVVLVVAGHVDRSARQTGGRVRVRGVRVGDELCRVFGAVDFVGSINLIDSVGLIDFVRVRDNDVCVDEVNLGVTCDVAGTFDAIQQIDEPDLFDVVEGRAGRDDKNRPCQD